MLWTRIHGSRIKTLINQCQRYYHSSSSIHRGGGYTKITITNKGFPERIPLFDRNGTVRFYAAPILPEQKKSQQKGKYKVRMNESVTAEFVRLVVDDGHEVVSRGEALDRAKRLSMDLVEVDRIAKPPVCRIMDYHRELYKKKLKVKEKTKTKADKTLRSGPTKECRFTKKTEQKDLETKANNVKRALEKGHRVKCMATGTEDQDLGAMLARLSALIEDFAVVESGPMVEKKQAYVVVRHKKFGFKKGPSKKSSTASPSKASSIKSAQNQGPLETEEELDHTESQSESEDTDLDQTEESDSDEMDLPNAGVDKIAWSTADATEDVDVFGLDERNKGASVPPSPVPNASLPYLNPKLDDRQVDKNRFSGGNEVRSRFQSPLPDNRYEVSPRHASQGNRGPPSTNTAPRGPAQVSDSRYNGQGEARRPRGPAQVSENRYNGQGEAKRFQPALPIDRATEKTFPIPQINRGASATNTIPCGPAQVGENRYNGQADVRNRFQRPNPIERTAETARVNPAQFNRGPGATSPVNYGSMPPNHHGRQLPSTEHSPFKADATPVGNLKMPPRTEQADPNVTGPQRSSYGIFSGPKQPRNVASEPGVPGPSASQNINGMPRSSEDTQSPGKFGIFSKESPKTYQQSNSDYQTKVQR